MIVYTFCFICSFSPYLIPMATFLAARSSPSRVMARADLESNLSSPSEIGATKVQKERQPLLEVLALTCPRRACEENQEEEEEGG